MKTWANILLGIWLILTGMVKLYAGGYFTSIGKVPLSCMAVLSSN